MKRQLLLCAAAVLLVSVHAGCGSQTACEEDASSRACVNEELEREEAGAGQPQTSNKQGGQPKTSDKSIASSEPRSLDEVKSSGDQYALARELGYDLCSDPIYPQKAAADPVGYAEEQFGGPDGFDKAREAGCLQALGR